MKACLLECKTATLNAQVTFVNVAVAISALAGGAIQKNSHRALPELVFSYFLADFWVLRSEMVLRWNIGSFWRVWRYIEMGLWVVLEGIGVTFFWVLRSKRVLGWNFEIVLGCGWLFFRRFGLGRFYFYCYWLTDLKQLRCGRPPHAKRGEYIEMIWNDIFDINDWAEASQLQRNLWVIEPVDWTAKVYI